MPRGNVTPDKSGQALTPEGSLPDVDHEPIFKTTLADMTAEWEADAEESDDPEWTRERNWTACLMIMDYGISE